MTETTADATTAAGATHSVSLEGKLILVGETSVGKTSIMARFSNKGFQPRAAPTIQAQFTPLEVRTGHDKVNLRAWDTAGEERFRSLSSLHYRGASAALIVYDVTSRKSFDAVPRWLDQVKKQAHSACIIAIAGNKCDTNSSGRQVSQEEGYAFARERGMIFYETSAKTGHNTKELLRAIAHEGPLQFRNGNECAFKIIEIDRFTPGLVNLGGSSKDLDGAQTRRCCA
eukprot:gb/GECG01015939.1/.p1 GENE.gb/GECG01015939.1/~~gb/GECG01015939.1/.p1  ORF type:complete len:228 (+),score=25.50 gb/GECG01015939.1/:1-684(+)